MIGSGENGKRREILLLNPPGDLPYLRDYYCSHSSKANYFWHPYDLLAQSGILGLEHEVQAFDPAVVRMSKARARAELMRRDFDTILMLSGAVSLIEDFEFVQSVPGLTEKTFIATGDIFLYYGKELMEKYPYIDALLLDFTSRCLLPWLRGDLDGTPVSNLVYRHRDETIQGGRHLEKRVFQLPLPHYEIFPWKKYRIPHGRSFPFGSIITDFGCPYHCNFCVSADLPYKWRDIDDVMRELRYLRSLGIRDLCDQGPDLFRQPEASSGTLRGLDSGEPGIRLGMPVARQRAGRGNAGVDGPRGMSYHSVRGGKPDRRNPEIHQQADFERSGEACFSNVPEAGHPDAGALCHRFSGGDAGNGGGDHPLCHRAGQRFRLV
jgi:hypothetical protein